ncbi:MAG TPA: acetate/propionate family kinase, partial [Acidocella sp.]|nr:acetate/propionate family kinase [Acidocella sp.]
MADAILTINAGSSSIKFALFELGAELTRVAEGLAEGIGTAPHLLIKAGGKVALEKRWPEHAPETHEELMGEVLDWVENHLGDDELVGAGHRIVHGGVVYTAPTKLDKEVFTDLTKLDPLAPLHEPHNLAAIRTVFTLRPELPQVGCFDTAFHHTMPTVATRVAIPRAFWAEGVRRYGFHGLSYEYIAEQLRAVSPHLAKGRVIVAHLGNGASLCALKNGVSIESTMGFTALEGLIMGTRCGSIDPGVLLYLGQEHGMDANAITDLLYKKSGLLGVSGISPDVRTLLASPAPEAAEALEMFTYSIAKHAGALISVLGGLDGIVFTAGIGEHAAPVRAAVCERLAWTGLELNAQANAANEVSISTP